MVQRALNFALRVWLASSIHEAGAFAKRAHKKHIFCHKPQRFHAEGHPLPFENKQEVALPKSGRGQPRVKKGAIPQDDSHVVGIDYFSGDTIRSAFAYSPCSSGRNPATSVPR